jgi:putative membrane protein
MSEPPPYKGAKLDDPRVYLAVERTYLAWIRTGLAMMGFGFVVARFGIFLQEINAFRPANTPSTHGFSAQFGTALVIFGVVLTFTAVIRYIRLLRRLDRGERLTRPSRLAIILGVALAVAGSVASAYLLLTSWRD